MAQLKLSDYFPEMEGYKTVEPAAPKAQPQLPVEVTQQSPYLRTTTPLPMQYPPDTLKQYNRPGLSSFRSSVLPPSGLPTVNSTAAGVTKVITQQAANSLLLETNGVENADQELLNLVAGANTTISSDASGNTTITAGGGGDGVIHGYNNVVIPATWWDDPAFIIYRDDFATGSNSTGTIGQLLWETNGSSPLVSRINIAAPAGSVFPNQGALCLNSNASTANSNASINWPSTANVPDGPLNGSMPLLDYAGWEVTWVFGFTKYFPGDHAGSNTFSLANSSNYVGLVGSGTFSPSIIRPSVFFGARFDNDTTSPSIGDTTIHLEAVMNGVVATPVRFNNQGTNGGVFDTGITPVQGQSYRLTISYPIVGTMKMTLSGGGVTASTTFTLTKPVTTCATGASITSAVGGALFPGAPSVPGQSNGLYAGGAGSFVTIAGLTGGAAALNGNYIVGDNWNTDQDITVYDTRNLGAFTAGVYTKTGYPGLYAYAAGGNNSTGGVQGSSGFRALFLDFFGLTFNPGGLSSPTLAATSTLSRFF